MLHHPPRSNPDTHKAGDSPKAIPAGFPPATGAPAGRHVFARISKSGKVSYYRGDLSSHRTVAEIDAQNASGRTAGAAGHGLNDRPGCTGSDFSFHNGSDT